LKPDGEQGVVDAETETVVQPPTTMPLVIGWDESAPIDEPPISTSFPPTWRSTG
jgi:hypothetical protein